MTTDLQSELAALFGRGVDAPLAESEFNRLALAVFRYQFERNRPYSAYCRGRGRTPDVVTDWREVPALPTDAFKEADLSTVAAGQAKVLYLTSGTLGGTERRGRHLLPDTSLYDASLTPNFKAHLLPDRERIRILVCGPTEPYFPHSSLGHMHSRVLELFGSPGSGAYWNAEGPCFPELYGALADAEREGAAVCLLGTAFGLVHFLDWLASEGRSLRLPGGSRLMDTGGYKGRSREVPKAELHALYQERLGIPASHVVNEYGMTELGSQFYDRHLYERYLKPGSGSPARRRKVPPPWVKVQVVDPETLEPVREGPGLLRFFDLANLHTVAAIQTDDLGEWTGDGFEVLGRAAGAEPRGCSLAVEEFLSARKVGQG